MNCLADGQDASYFFARPRWLDTGRIYAAVGTLATETGNATYVGLSVNDAYLDPQQRPALLERLFTDAGREMGREILNL